MNCLLAFIIILVKCLVASSIDVYSVQSLGGSFSRFFPVVSEGVS